MMLMIQMLRCQQNMSQRELAEIVGVGQAAISMWEGGANRPRAERLPVLAQALNCTIDQLFTEISDEETFRWATSGLRYRRKER
ncbi:MAG: helix-turn-helix transcriptional regulator [Clostridiales bacterium]|nr:helix-turn-helix transcriptional regulator [Clostridiales bacterium]